MVRVLETRKKDNKIDLNSMFEYYETNQAD